MRRMADEGITTREACGNSVRNITACPFAGIAADEVFDVTPYAEALTRYLLRHPLSAILPRKFKIAFEGCPEDHALASINDLGWTARIEDRGGQPARGFRLTVGGGTSILPVTGRVLFDFLPAGEVLNVAEAIVRVYHQLGDHEHRQRNRMKFLIKTLGWERWRDEVLHSLDRVRTRGEPSFHSIRTRRRSRARRIGRPTRAFRWTPSAASCPLRQSRGPASSRRSPSLLPTRRRSARGARPTCGRSVRRAFKPSSSGFRLAISPPVNCARSAP